MPRALLGAVGSMLVFVVMAPAQVPAPQPQNQQTPVRKEGLNRLEEMKVELALVEDPILFPYSLAASDRGEFLQLYGFVPNDGLRQRALDVARRSTSLVVHEALGLLPANQKTNQALQPSPRSANELQKEGAELLQTGLGEPAKGVSLEARADGMVVLTGRIDSMENKLKACRLLRKLPGCCGVVNKLTVEEIVRDGQKMMRVMHDDSLLVSSSLLGKEPKPSAAPPPPTIQLTTDVNAKKSEVSLPTPVPPKQESPRLKPVPAKIDKNVEEFAPSKLPVKWGRPTSSWETQVNDLKSLQAARQQNLMPTPLETPSRPVEPAKPPAPMTVSKPSPVPISTRPSFAETQPKPPVPVAVSKPNPVRINTRPGFAETQPTPSMTWRRPGGSEESEPKIQPPAIAPEASAQTLPSLRSSRRWPPAYVTGPPPSQGRPGVIAFEEDPPRPNPAIAAPATSGPIVPADLQRQVKSLCGREAREVTVSLQRDGSVLVKVKVANRSIEDRLSRRILELPDMTAPRVRLMMEIGP